MARMKAGWPAFPILPSAAPIPSTVVKRLPTSTTNITGFRNCTFGLSFAKESRIAASTIARVSSGARARGLARKSV